jgi:acetyltransferase-like isoleucine patch superfamily enzyme
MKNFIAITISLLPLNLVRIFLYNKILKYNISKNSSIGFLTIINSQNCEILDSYISSFNFIKIKKIYIKNSKIHCFNIIKNFYSFSVSQNSIIKNKNKFYGETKLNSNSKLEINENCQIGSENFFDLSGNITINNNCKILNYCQFWTHGFNANREIKIGVIDIGENVILENSVTIISNIKITSNCIVKISSVVNKSLLEENTYSSNKLIKK